VWEPESERNKSFLFAVTTFASSYWFWEMTLIDFASRDGADLLAFCFFMVVPALLAIAMKCEQEQCMADQDQKKLLVLERTKKKCMFG
jgi:hypothetical protein